MRFGCAPRLSLRCHLHINGSSEQALLPLDFGTGNWGLGGGGSHGGRAQVQMFCFKAFTSST